GIGFIHRFMPIEEQVACIEKSCGRVGGTIGVTGDYRLHTSKLIDAGATVILIDVAHGHHMLVENALKRLKPLYPTIPFIAGSISTAEAAEALIAWGADALRVGQGNGSLCETRVKTGCGVPQITALQEIKKVSGNTPIISCGGIRTPGDFAKAIAAGADTVILGSLLAGTKESPGDIKRQGTWPNEVLFKEYRGSASASAKKARGEEVKNIEGNSKQIPYKGKVERIIDDLMYGLRSAMSYVGAIDIKSFQERAEFMEVTNAGIAESKPHLLG
ncbi:guanosine monophosphate reductase, partial [Candidatus Peregrinibacteria bacterium]|nr:guanosine monophosphate reductase [Candidatus Peregrinibacteria bacterium]